MKARPALAAAASLFFVCNAVGAAAQPKAHAAAWSVRFVGAGNFAHIAEMPRAPMCDTPLTSDAESEFSWDFEWAHVVFGPHPSVGTPTGKLSGRALQTNNLNAAQGGNPGCNSPVCQKEVDFDAGVGDQAEPMTVLDIGPQGKNYAIEVSYANTPSMAEMASGCHHIDTMFDFYIPWSSEGRTPTIDAFGLHAFSSVTLAQLEARKPISLEIGSSSSPPDDCSTPYGPSIFPCGREQDWAGEILLQPQ
jgi:hypothetical protein